MHWLLVSPGHQYPWYWLCKFLSYMREDFNYLWYVSVEEWYKLQIHFYLPHGNLARKGLSCLHRLQRSCAVGKQQETINGEWTFWIANYFVFNVCGLSANVCASSYLDLSMVSLACHLFGDKPLSNPGLICEFITKESAIHHCYCYR